MEGEVAQEVGIVYLIKGLPTLLTMVTERKAMCFLLLLRCWLLGGKALGGGIAFGSGLK